MGGKTESGETHGNWHGITETGLQENKRKRRNLRRCIQPAMPRTCPPDGALSWALEDYLCIFFHRNACISVIPPSMGATCVRRCQVKVHRVNRAPETGGPAAQWSGTAN